LLNQFYNLKKATESDQKSIKDTCRLLEGLAAALREGDTQELELLFDDADAARQRDGGSQAKFIERKLVVESSRRVYDEGSISCARKQEKLI
jgi:hypothetical protein